MKRAWQNLTIFLCIILLSYQYANAQNVRSTERTENDQQEILTPAPNLKPRINGPLVYGARPDHSFLYRIPCQGVRPIVFSVKNLPFGLSLNSSTGIITGNTPKRGIYNVTITASNLKGKDHRSFKIVSGDQLALTPPMGWNDWYVHYDRVTDLNIREAADAMINTGMADVGYQYVNIDDCWMNAPGYKDKDPKRAGPLRDGSGNILPNSYFPDMNGLTHYIHADGLKAGIYTSPGPLTCGGFAGAYQHEEQDAKQFADWGFDFLKYDWCSYGHIALGGNPEDKDIPHYGQEAQSLEGYKRPYKLMGDILKKQNRDIVFNLCQYGMADVWKWGGEVGGNCWRTAGDLGFELDRIFDIAIKNSEHREYSKPGEWNDPDYIQIGYIGNAGKMGIAEMTHMPANMQYAYMSLWSLMAAPLIFSGDMTRLDKFTLNVLCNPEVIDVDQDPSGKSGRVIQKADGCFIMVKDLADGSKAVGLFNRGEKTKQVTVNWSDLHISGKRRVRDLWRERYVGTYSQKYAAQVPPKGVMMIKVQGI